MYCDEVATELSHRLTRIFLHDQHGRRPVYGEDTLRQTDPHWRELILFYAYFPGENGSGLGTSHQTGWTALIAKLLPQLGDRLGQSKMSSPIELKASTI